MPEKRESQAAGEHVNGAAGTIRTAARPAGKSLLDRYEAVMLPSADDTPSPDTDHLRKMMRRDALARLRFLRAVSRGDHA